MRVARAIALLASAALLAAPGCNMAVPALYVAQGPPKRPAMYTLPADKKVVVFVDDRQNVISRLQLRAALGDDVSNEFRRLKLVSDVVSGRELISYVRRVETSAKRVSIEELGDAVKADIVVYVEMESFALSPDGATPKPVASAYVKVVDVKGKERLFPPLGGDPKGQPVASELDSQMPDAFRTSAQRRRMEDMLEKKLADDIAKLFYEYEPKNFGEGVSRFSNG
ncbi:MAG: hypothetical protein FJ260_00270 [Planctomycetes bacterium]|nr:hypothetical protein [Planctomycetota bacterium]